MREVVYPPPRRVKVDKHPVSLGSKITEKMNEELRALALAAEKPLSVYVRETLQIHINNINKKEFK